MSKTTNKRKPSPNQEDSSYNEEQEGINPRDFELTESEEVNPNKKGKVNAPSKTKLVCFLHSRQQVNSVGKETTN